METKILFIRLELYPTNEQGFRISGFELEQDKETDDFIIFKPGDHNLKRVKKSYFQVVRQKEVTIEQIELDCFCYENQKQEFIKKLLEVSKNWLSVFEIRIKGFNRAFINAVNSSDKLFTQDISNG